MAQWRAQVVRHGISETLQFRVGLRQLRRTSFQPFIGLLQILFGQIALPGFPVNHETLDQQNENGPNVSQNNDDLYLPRAGGLGIQPLA